MMRRSMSKTVFFLLFLVTFFQIEYSLYVPGVAPVEFKHEDEIRVKAIKLTSTITLIPYDYYSLPFCKPEGELQYKSENLGEVMRGDRIVNTPFKIRMKVDESCSTLCSDATKTTKIDTQTSDLLIRRIKEDYHVHLLVDNLPCAVKVGIPGGDDFYFDHGYKLGWVDNSGKVYVNNHLDIVLKYHKPTVLTYRVVGFQVSPRSVDYSTVKSFPASCVTDSSVKMQQMPSEGAEIAWTYSVSWEQSDIPWASRWDTYLTMKDVNIHWFSIVNSLIVVFCLFGFLSVIIVRTVRRDIAQYNQDENVEDTLEETGWKLVHGDVFRPPPGALLLVTLIGTGIQLLGMVFVTVFFAMLGMLSPASRGSLTSAGLFLYCFMGLIAGYYSGRLYKTLRGVQPKRTAIQMAIFFPAVVFGSGFILNLFLIDKHSSGAVPFSTILALLFMWFGIDLPLVFIGFHFGYRKQVYAHPVRTNQIPRQVPESPWYYMTVPSMLMAGILPFGAVFIELFFIFSAIWDNQFYYLFGILFLVYLILAISCAQISIVATYFQLCMENYHWWWKSFLVSGGSALYVMAYSFFYYYTKLEIVGFIPTLLYFSYSFLMSLAFFLLTGTIGFYTSYLFLFRIYAAVKID